MAILKCPEPWSDDEFKNYIRRLLRPIKTVEDREDMEQEIYCEILRLNITDYDEMVDIAYIVYNRLKSRIRRYNERFISVGDMNLG